MIKPHANLAPSLIELRDVTKVYGQGEAEVRALDGVNLAVGSGEFAAVMDRPVRASPPP